MRIAWRETRRGDLPKATILAALAVLGWLFAPVASGLWRWLPECNFHRWTGWACPSCGMTRATLALARGEPAAALQCNPLFTVTLVTVSLAALAAPLAVGLMRRVPVVTGAPSRAGWWLLAAAILANWAYLIFAGV